MNINTQDVAMMNETTKFVTGTPEGSNDPGPFTAHGVLVGMKAGAKHLFGSDSLKDKTVLIQGVGSVGAVLCELLAKEGAILKINNRGKQKIESILKKVDATVVSSEDLLSTKCDIFAPCAMGAVLNTENVKRLDCKIIAGAANNVCLDPATGDALKARGILYLPDYIVNAGGVINCGVEVSDGKFDLAVVNKMIDNIYNTTMKIISLAEKKNISTYHAADEYALEIVAAAKK